MPLDQFKTHLESRLSIHPSLLSKFKLHVHTYARSTSATASTGCSTVSQRADLYRITFLSKTAWTNTTFRLARVSTEKRLAERLL